MKLNSIIKNAPEIEIEELSIDSRVKMNNAMYFCLDGIKYDGHNYIEDAINNGAKVIVYSKEIQNKKGAIYIRVNDVHEALNKIADIFYNHPSDNMNKYLISGCYGRSSVSSIIYDYLKQLNNCAYIGVLGIKYDDFYKANAFPALTALDNVKYLKKFKDKNINNCVFESSPISLFYRKMDSIKPNVFIYTNTSKICSDYLVCNNNYYQYIRNYLYTFENNSFVVLNQDDESYNELKDCVANFVTYGQSKNANYLINDIRLNANGSSFNLINDGNVYEIKTKLLSLANVYNITAAIVGLHLMGHNIPSVIEFINNFDYIDGVLEKVDNDYNVIIDCAYEIDSIKNILEFAKHTTAGRLYCLLGINDSDDNKRIENIMKLCGEYVDSLVLTEDESLEREVMYILRRCDNYIGNARVAYLQNRKVAIDTCISMMDNKDTLLILGKGNEKFLSMGLGKEFYAGDKHNALKYLNKKKGESNETI